MLQSSPSLKSALPRLSNKGISMIDIEEQRIFELDDFPATLAASLPPKIREAIDRFVWYGVPTGGFVQAVLSNDLMGAVGRADADSLSAIGLICQYVYNAVPSVCHGSREAVKSHIERGRKAREEIQE